MLCLVASLRLSSHTYGDSFGTMSVGKHYLVRATLSRLPLYTAIYIPVVKHISNRENCGVSCSLDCLVVLIQAYYFMSTTRRRVHVEKAACASCGRVAPHSVERTMKHLRVFDVELLVLLCFLIRVPSGVIRIPPGYFRVCHPIPVLHSFLTSQMYI